MVYHYWTVITDGPEYNKQATKLCRCKCGTVKFISIYALASGNSKSCGCYRGELLGARQTTHGGSGHSAYVTWTCMVERCTQPRHPSWALYGGSGITVCDRWLVYENFFADMGHNPGQHELDRIDNTKGYYKENCRWVTRIENMRNRTTTRVFRGRKMFRHEIAKELGVDPKTIHNWETYHPTWTLDEIVDYELNRKILRNNRNT